VKSIRLSRSIAFLSLVALSLAIARSAHAFPEYAAYAGSNCMACHVGPTGGGGRKVQSMNDVGYISDRVSLSGDFLFMALYDQRAQPAKDRFVMFPMEAAVHLNVSLTPKITLAATNDFGTMREAYAMLHNEAQTMYVRAGFFTLPYGLLFADHTSFVKEGRVENGTRTFDELGIGAGLFSTRYKDSGIEAGLSGQPFFANISMTSGVVGQEERSFPSSQSGTRRAITRRAGFINRNFCLGASMYTNDNELLDRRIMRYGAFGWAKFGRFVLLAEHDEGEDERFTVGGSSQSYASYVEAVYAFPFPGRRTSYAKVRYERLDPNRSIDGDVLERFVPSYRFSPTDYLEIEAFYRFNKEQTHEKADDDAFILSRVYF
jgi:hypothetical protein